MICKNCKAKIPEESKYVICAILQSDLVIKQIVRLSTGSSSSRARVQVEDLLNDVYIPVLPQAVQKEISDSTYDTTKKIWSQAQKFLKSYAKELIKQSKKKSYILHLVRVYELS